jgi:hypothetical protein
MLVNVEISVNFELKIEAAVMGEKFEHVIKETNSSGNLVSAAAFDDQGGADVGFLGSASHLGSSHRAATFLA